MKTAPGITDYRPRVLIVDDERQNRQVLEVMLWPEGFLLRSAASGEEALAIVAEQPPDVILLDIMMPGMDGYEVAATLKRNLATQSIPVIMVTALGDHKARMLGLSVGAEDFLTKPVDRAELCLRVRNLSRLKTLRDDTNELSRVLQDEVDSRTADLVDSARLYRETFDAAPLGIAHVGLDGQWRRVNQRLCDMLGMSREELQGLTAEALVHSDEAADEAELFRHMAAGRLDRHVLEKRYRRGDGTFMWARVIIAVHRDADGQAKHFIAVIEDITERRMLEPQVRQAAQMDALGGMAAAVAHDFNNLLTVILGCAELVAADTGVASQHGEDLGEIIKAAGRARSLTKQLLAFSRQQVLLAAPLDLNELITDMSGMFRRLIAPQIDVALVLAPDLSLAFVDRGHMEQVVMNLVVNASDAMPDGGTITIETADIELEDGPFHDETIMPGHYVMLAVTDTGTGMTAETRRRLFEPFYTTKEVGRGTGLGLSTTYGIVKQSKGCIRVYSVPQQGTTFNVYLPRASP